MTNPQRTTLKRRKTNSVKTNSVKKNYRRCPFCGFRFVGILARACPVLECHALYFD